MRSQRMEPKSPKAFQLIDLSNHARAFRLEMECIPCQESLSFSFPLLCEEDPHHQVRIQLIFGQSPLPALGKRSIRRYPPESLLVVRQVRGELEKLVFFYFSDPHNHCVHSRPLVQGDTAR